LAQVFSPLRWLPCARERFHLQPGIRRSESRAA
jgi:hypothetical protein